MLVADTVTGSSRNADTPDMSSRYRLHRTREYYASARLHSSRSVHHAHRLAQFEVGPPRSQISTVRGRSTTLTDQHTEGQDQSITFPRRSQIRLLPTALASGLVASSLFCTSRFASRQIEPVHHHRYTHL